VLVRGAPPSTGVSEKPFRFKEKNVGIAIGVVVLLVSIGFVVLMVVSEWSHSPEGQPLAENPAAAPAEAPARKPSAKKAAKRQPKAAAKKKKKK
jgi:hypothetical protein